MRIIGMRQNAACCAYAEVTDARSCRAPCRPERRTLPPVGAGWEAVAVKGLARVDDEEDLVNISRERSRR